MARKGWIRQEAEQLALVVVLCQRVIASTSALVPYDHGPEKAEETRRELYKNVALVRRAIDGLYALHRPPADDPRLNA